MCDSETVRGVVQRLCAEFIAGQTDRQGWWMLRCNCGMVECRVVVIEYITCDGWV